MISQLKNSKKILFLLMVMIISSNFSSAQLIHGPEQAKQQNQSQYGTIIVYREDDNNTMRSSVIFMDGKIVGSLLPNEYMQTDICFSGIQLNIASRGSVVDTGLIKSLDIAPNTTNYVKVVPNNRSFFIETSTDPKTQEYISTLKNISNVINRQVCTKGTTKVVLLDTNNSTHNAVVVSTKSGEVILDKPYSYVIMTGDTEKPTMPKALDPVIVKQQYAKELSTLPLKPESFLFYFDNEEIKQSSKNQIEKLKKAIAMRKPASIDIIGHADTIDSTNYNYKLGLTRAKRTEVYLRSQGIDMTRSRLVSYGENTLMVDSPDETFNPLNRCVEVFVR